LATCSKNQRFTAFDSVARVSIVARGNQQSLTSLAATAEVRASPPKGRPRKSPGPASATICWVPLGRLFMSFTVPDTMAQKDGGTSPSA